MKLRSKNDQFIIGPRPIKATDGVCRSRTRNDLAIELQVAKNQFLLSISFNQTGGGANVVRLAQEFSVEHLGPDRITAVSPGRAEVATVHCGQRSVSRGH